MRVTQMPASGRHNVKVIESPERRKPMTATNNGIDIKRILSDFEKDDYILLGLIAVLVFEGCDDYILLAALGYLFLMGFKD